MTTILPMRIEARLALLTDLDALTALSTDLAAEQAALRPVWPAADGLDEPVEATLAALIEGDDAGVVVGAIDGTTVGFLVTGTATLHAPDDGRRVGIIRLIYVDPDARGVGVGDAMLERAIALLTGRGADLFDAPVSPGHRLAKNFFESHGFKARSIVMHRAGAPAPTPVEDRP